MNEPKTPEPPTHHPVQKPRYSREQAMLPTAVTLAAYEVYSHVFAPQEALVTGGCRGGFGMGELIAFLYARPFPKAEWNDRVHDVLHEMRGFQ